MAKTDYFDTLEERVELFKSVGVESTIRNTNRYYSALNDKIVEFNKARPLTFYDAYPFDWARLFTPIERHAWNIIRSAGNIVLYPQYPVLNYRADFANPLLKIILECDGKGYHDRFKDQVRDRNLHKSGWKVFRVTGSETYKDRPLSPLDYIEDEESETVDYFTPESLKEFYLNTADGVITALRAVYFTGHNPHNLEGKLQLETLEKHRLINFPI